MSAAPRFGDVQERMDRASILVSQVKHYARTGALRDIPGDYFINAVWLLDALQGSIVRFHTVIIPRPLALFPPEWRQKEAFEATMRNFAPLVHPLLRTWLPTKILYVAPTVNHIIDCTMPLPDLQTHMVHARFLRKAIDIAYSIIESTKGRAALQKLLEQMVMDWNAAKKSHAYNHHSPKLATEQADVVAHFLNRLRRSFPVMKIRADSEMDGKICIVETVRDDRTEMVPMWQFNPREEVAIAFNLKACTCRHNSL